MIEIQLLWRAGDADGDASATKKCIVDLERELFCFVFVTRKLGLFKYCFCF